MAAPSIFQMVWDPTNKKWTIIVDGAAAVDLEQNVMLADGTEALPSLRFAQDTDNGMRRRTTNEIALITTGADRWVIDASGHLIPADDNSYDLGGSSNAVKDLYLDGALVGLKEVHGGCIYDSNGLSSAVNFVVWRAPYACTVTNVRGYLLDGTNVVVNAYKNGSSGHLSSDLTVSSPPAWADGGTVQNTGYSAGDYLQVRFVSFSGSPTYAVVQVDFVRA